MRKSTPTVRDLIQHLAILCAFVAMGCAANGAALSAGDGAGGPAIVGDQGSDVAATEARDVVTRETDTRDDAENEFGDDFEDDFGDDFEDELEAELVVFDPLEPLNRGIFWVNDKLYFYLFKPVVRVYRYVPESARASVSNFFYNLATPLRFANKFLQVKFEEASAELGRFLVNTTIGVGGLFDPASRSEWLRKKETDFGLTLGHYDVSPGFYLVLPLLGPSNLRDGVGTVTEWVIDPLNLVLGSRTRIGLTVLDQGTELSLDKDTYEAIVKDSLDPYLFIRNAYTQQRAAQIAE